MIDIQGLTELQAALAQWPAAVTGLMQRATQEAFSVMKPDLQAYPPPRRYERTYKLRGGWGAASPTFQGSGFAFTATLANDATDYGPYVQDADEQAWMHKGVWATTETILDDDLQKVETVFEDWCQDLVDTIG